MITLAFVTLIVILSIVFAAILGTFGLILGLGGAIVGILVAIGAVAYSFLKVFIKIALAVLVIRFIYRSFSKCSRISGFATT